MWGRCCSSFMWLIRSCVLMFKQVMCVSVTFHHGKKINRGCVTWIFLSQALSRLPLKPCFKPDWTSDSYRISEATWLGWNVKVQDKVNVGNLSTVPLGRSKKGLNVNHLTNYIGYALWSRNVMSPLDIRYQFGHAYSFKGVFFILTIFYIVK